MSRTSLILNIIAWAKARLELDAARRAARAANARAAKAAHLEANTWATVSVLRDEFGEPAA